MHEIVLKFHIKKDAHKLLRNLSKGKGMVVRPEMLGGGFLSGLGNIGKKIYNQVEDIRTNPATQKIGNFALDKGLDLAGKYAEKKLMAGGGLFGEIGNVVDELTGKGIGRRGRPRKSHKKEDGDGLFGSIGNVIDAISGDGVKPKKGVRMSKALKLYRGGSFSPLG